MTPHAFDCPEADRLVDDALRAIGAEIDALRVPRLLGVVLGGGYARGEGGVVLRASRATQVPSPKSQGPGLVPDGRPATCDLRPATPAEPALSNDLDFYVVADDGSSGAELAAIAAALRPVSEKWTARLGVDVDFSPPKTPWRIAHDAERLMIQELIHGYCDVAGKPGSELFAGVPRRPPEALPFLEAVRLLVNRGVGLLLAVEPGASPEFVARNINKCILGSWDAWLIARGKYRWRALDRAAACGDDDRYHYRAAVQWKFRPKPEPVCDWETAQAVWIDTCVEIDRLPWSRPYNWHRTLRAAARWLVRRRSLGPEPFRTLGLDPLVRILRALYPLVCDRKSLPSSLRRDWEVFN